MWMMTVKDPHLVDRLENWKFGSAATILDKLPEGSVSKDDRCVIEALSLVFNNVGSVDGQMGDIIHAAVAWLIDTPNPSPDLEPYG
jgi:hypothetical protein